MDLTLNAAEQLLRIRPWGVGSIHDDCKQAQNDLLWVFGGGELYRAIVKRDPIVGGRAV